VISFQKGDGGRTPAWAWLLVAVSLATVPFARGLVGSGIFYIRDLSLFFWGRHLWLRRTLWSGEWPLWDPYLGGGQSAAADALHQMFLLPTVALRMIGSERVGFNLWVALPFPLAALGAWGFFARRFSSAAAAAGAVAFAVAGPIVSTGNFPNMSWSVAAIPWVLWTVDSAVARSNARGAGLVALAVAFQALAGEPVTLAATLATAIVFAAFVAGDDAATARRVNAALRAGAGMVLGLMVAAIQLVPLAEAAALADRSNAIVKHARMGMWSMRPLATLEAIALHLFGDYYRAQSLADTPWMPALNTGREPFFFSIYLGVPLLMLALVGLVSGRSRRWGIFWAVVAAAALVGAFGSYTPIYPFIRDRLPLLSSFRFPVKYLVIVCLAVAALCASGWDALEALASNGSGEIDARTRGSRTFVVGAVIVVALVAGGVAAFAIYFQQSAANVIFSLARSVGTRDPLNAVRSMLRDLPRLATIAMLLSLTGAGLLLMATRGADRSRATARTLLFALIAGDLVTHAWGINPTFDPAYLAEPQWMAQTRVDPSASFYIGGKYDGTLDPTDLDSAKAFRNAPGLVGSASRAALSAQAAFYPSAWKSREVLSYDLPMLWPMIFQDTADTFIEKGRVERDRFLARTGVRYRVLPDRIATGHSPVMPVPYFLEASLYDWGQDQVAPRARIVATATVVSDPSRQMAALFEDGWDDRITVLVDHEAGAAGAVGAPQTPFAKIIAEASNRSTVEAGVGEGGGYLVLLDSYAAGWRATVDGEPATIVRANGLFRGVHLPPGHHFVEFLYRPRAFYVGGTVSAAALLLTLVLVMAPRHLLLSRAGRLEHREMNSAQPIAR
jgi:hypothetical protein